MLGLLSQKMKLIFSQGVLNSSSDINLTLLESAAELLLAHNLAFTRNAEKGSYWKLPGGFLYVQ